MYKAIPKGMAFFMSFLRMKHSRISFFRSFKAWVQLAFLIPVMEA